MSSIEIGLTHSVQFTVCHQVSKLRWLCWPKTRYRFKLQQNLTQNNRSKKKSTFGSTDSNRLFEGFFSKDFFNCKQKMYLIETMWTHLGAWWGEHNTNLKMLAAFYRFICGSIALAKSIFRKPNWAALPSIRRFDRMAGRTVAVRNARNRLPTIWIPIEPNQFRRSCFRLSNEIRCRRFDSRFFNEN